MDGAGGKGVAQGLFVVYWRQAPHALLLVAQQAFVDGAQLQRGGKAQPILESDCAGGLENGAPLICEGALCLE